MRLDDLFAYDCVALAPEGDGVVIVDQTLLPWEERFLTLKDEGQVYEAIARLRVRGAPAIGIAAAYGLYVAFRRVVLQPGFDGSKVSAEFFRISRYLSKARPTAVNLSAAIGRMERRFKACMADGIGIKQMLAALRMEAESIKAEDMSMCLSIAEYGAGLIDRPGMGILLIAMQDTMRCPAMARLWPPFIWPTAGDWRPEYMRTRPVRLCRGHALLSSSCIRPEWT